MANIAAQIEALELHLMRAWLAGGGKATRKLLGRDFVAMIGTLPPQLLDRPSFIAAVDGGFALTKFVFHEVLIRPQGKSAWFAAGAELELALGARAWAGPFLLTGLWRKGALGGWKLTERSLARLDQTEGLAAVLGKLQLWT